MSFLNCRHRRTRIAPVRKEPTMFRPAHPPPEGIKRGVRKRNVAPGKPGLTLSDEHVTLINVNALLTL